MTKTIEERIDEIGFELESVTQARLDFLKANPTCTDKQIEAVLEAHRFSAGDHILLPSGRYDNLSRGRGWCRLGRGPDAQWAHDDGDGYIVSKTGTWTVGSTDGFSRKENLTYKVKKLKVGSSVCWIAM